MMVLPMHVILAVNKASVGWAVVELTPLMKLAVIPVVQHLVHFLPRFQILIHSL